MHPRVALAGALIAAAAVASCGGPPSSTPASSEPLTMMPSSSDLITALVFTESLATTAVDIDVTSRIGNRQQERSARGTVGMRGGFGELTWADTGVRERRNGRGVFVQSPAPSGTWVHLRDGDTTDTLPLADLLRGLGQLADVSTEPAEGGTVRYSGTLPLTSEALDRFGLSREQKAAIGSAWQGTRMAAAVWVDGMNRIVRIDRTLDLVGDDGTPVHVEVTTRLSDFSVWFDGSPPSGAVSATATTGSP